MTCIEQNFHLSYLHSLKLGNRYAVTLAHGNAFFFSCVAKRGLEFFAQLVCVVQNFSTAYYHWVIFSLHPPNGLFTSFSVKSSIGQSRDINIIYELYFKLTNNL